MSQGGCEYANEFPPVPVSFALILTPIRQQRIVQVHTLIAYTTGMEFIEAPSFTRHLSDYLDDKGYSVLQAKLGANADLGDLMPGTGGFRKMRWAAARQGPERWIADYLLPLQVR
jgi:hypothetical protein